MGVLIWSDNSREQLAPVLGNAVVVLPIGATEQHGPHLPTRTDILVAERVVRRAADQAGATPGVDVIVAPGLPFGASDHHLRYGGTLSLSSATLLAVLEDLIDSLEVQGCRRLVIVNGHGGNRGALRAAASGADARESITVAAVDYWDAATDVAPGHAGRVETSFVLALEPDLVHSPPRRVDPPTIPSLRAGTYHGGWVWHHLDGFTDSPADADAAAGAQMLDDVVEGLAEIILSVAGMPG